MAEPAAGPSGGPKSRLQAPSKLAAVTVVAMRAYQSLELNLSMPLYAWKRIRAFDP